MRRLLIAIMVLGVCPSWAADREQLAGEGEPSQLKARPAVEAPEEGGPVTVSRSARGSASTFHLPEMLITGEGEAKALSQRPELRFSVDTSGGIQASPGEAGAGKDQVQAMGSKHALDTGTYESVSHFTQATLSAGAPLAGLGRLVVGRQSGPLTWLAEGAAETQRGAEVGAPAAGASTASDWMTAGGALHGGWQEDADQRYTGDLTLSHRSRGLVYAPGGGDFGRDAAGLSARWDRTFAGDLHQDLRAGVSWAQARLPGLGTFFDEKAVGLEGLWERHVSLGSKRLELGAEASLKGLREDLSAALPVTGESLALGKAGVSGRLEAWSGGRVTLGLDLSWLQGLRPALLLAPRVAFDQRLAARLSFYARLEPRLELPTFSGESFERDLALPPYGLDASRHLARLEAGLRQSLGDAWMQVSAWLDQAERSIELDDPAHTQVWSYANTGLTRRWGLGLQGRAEGPAGVNHSLVLGLTQGQDLDLASRHLTFLPAWDARWEMQSQVGPFHWRTALWGRAEQWARLLTDERSPAFVTLDARLDWQALDWLAPYVEGRNLIAQDLQLWPGYPEAKPYGGLGLVAVF